MKIGLDIGLTNVLGRGTPLLPACWTANDAELSAYNQYLTAYWKAEDTADSIGDNTLTNNNGVTFTSGKNNNAFTLNGSTQYMSVSDNVDISPTAGVAFSCWANFSGLTTQGLVGKDDAFFIFYDPALRDLYFGVYQSDNTLIRFDSNYTPTTGVFEHYVAIADSTAGKIYLYANNVEIGSAVYDGTIKDTADDFKIGQVLDFYFASQIDEIPFYKNPVFSNDAAREAFVEALFNSGTGSFFSNCSWTPAEISTKAWFDASDASTITESGGLVSQWDDKSGNGYHATQSNDAKKPTTGSLLGTKNALTFDGGDIIETTLSIDTNSSDLVVFAVGVQTGAAGSFRQMVTQWEAAGDNRMLNLGHNTTDIATLSAYNGSITGTTSLTSARILNGVIKNTAPSKVDLELFVDGTSEGTQTNRTITQNAGASIVIGGRNTLPLWIGEIGEVIILDANPSVDIRQKIEGYLAWGRGLQANLPAGHPYENRRPLLCD